MFVQAVILSTLESKKIMDTAGRVEKFKSRYGAFKR
jgi:ribosomal protein L31